MKDCRISMQNKPVEQANARLQDRPRNPHTGACTTQQEVAGKELLLVGCRLNCCMPDGAREISKCANLGSTLDRRTHIHFRSSSNAKIC